MVIRSTRPVTVVTQPTHAWLAGQIGRAWGNQQFPRPPLHEDLVYATVQHDIGYLDWERAPTLDPGTGFPHTYRTLPCSVHLELWRKGIAWMEPVSCFAAWIISLHSAGLYRRHFDWQNASESDSIQMREFISQQERYQREVIGSMSKSARYGVLNDPETVNQISYFVGTWDLLSLHLCERGSQPLILDEVPCARGTETIRLQSPDPEAGVWELAPWPFGGRELILHFDAREIAPPYGQDAELRADLQRACAQRVTLRLCPGDGIST